MMTAAAASGPGSETPFLPIRSGRAPARPVDPAGARMPHLAGGARDADDRTDVEQAESRRGRSTHRDGHES
jgi:hypothetical protein